MWWRISWILLGGCRVWQLCPFRGHYPKSQTFVSDSRESASSLVLVYGVFQFRENFSDGLGGRRLWSYALMRFQR